MIQIDEIVLRIPGMSEEEGRRLGGEVAECLAEEGCLPEGAADRKIAGFEIRIVAAPALSRGQLARAIAEQIAGKLNTAIQP